jgi:hypothetical protein
MWSEQSQKKRELFNFEILTLVDKDRIHQNRFIMLRT